MTNKGSFSGRILPHQEYHGFGIKFRIMQFRIGGKTKVIQSIFFFERFDFLFVERLELDYNFARCFGGIGLFACCIVAGI